MPTTRRQECADLLPVDAMLLACVAAAAGARELGGVPPLAGDQWDALFGKACRHNVAALVGALPAMRREPVPLETRLKFAAVEDRARRQFNQRCAVLSRMLELFNRHGLQTMLLKGVGISRHYPDPALREFSDIDIYLFGRQREADALAAAEWGVKVDGRSHHHTKYLLGGVPVENHYDIVSRYGAWGNRRTERQFKREAECGSIPFAVGGQDCLLPSPDMSALFLMRHMATHFAAETVTLRHLADWTLFVRAESGAVDWTGVVPSMERMGMLPFALAIEEICHRHLACPACIASAVGAAPQAELADRVLAELLGGESAELPPTSRPGARMRAKWARLLASRWKHDVCYPAPWLYDLPCMLWAKTLKPHTILH